MQVIIDESAIDVAGLLSEIDDLKIKLKQKQDVINVLQRENYPGTPQ